MRGSTKREHCPKCKNTTSTNYVHVEPGKDIEIYVECANCKTFVARYNLKNYVSHDFYKSFLRLLHERRMSSGANTQNLLEEFKKETLETFEMLKKEIQENEETKSLEDLL
ncbi:MAG: hypothetical protein ABIA04_13260 [Pseudomonadota bacterium]